MRELLLSEQASHNDETGVYYLTSANLAVINESPASLLVDVHLHLGPDLQPAGEDDSLYEVVFAAHIIMHLLQQGSFILRSHDTQWGRITIEGSVVAPQPAVNYEYPPDDYPGGFFRFQREPQSLYDKQVTLLKGPVNACWFGLPNGEGEHNYNAWLLRKALLAAEPPAVQEDRPPIPVYLPPGEYRFTDQIVYPYDPEHQVYTTPRSFHIEGSPSGGSILELDGINFWSDPRTWLFKSRLQDGQLRNALTFRNLTFKGIHEEGAPDYEFLGRFINLFAIEDVTIENCRFQECESAILLRVAHNIRIAGNHFENVYGEVVRFEFLENSPNNINDIIIHGNRFIRAPSYGNVDPPEETQITRSIRFSGPDNATQIARHRNIIVADNHFSENHCTAISFVRMSRNFLVNNNLIQFSADQSANEPITIGGVFPDNLQSEPPSLAAAEEFIMGGNSIINNFPNAGSILSTKQSKNAIFWANQILGGSASFYIGWRVEPSTEAGLRLQENLLIQANIGIKYPSQNDVAFCFMSQEDEQPPTGSLVKNVVLSSNALDSAFDYLLKYDSPFKPPQRNENEVRAAQNWQPANSIEGKDPYTVGGIKNGAIAIQPQNFYSAYFDALAVGVYTKYCALSFAALPSIPYPPPPILPTIHHLFGSTTNQHSPIDGFLGFATNHHYVERIETGYWQGSWGLLASSESQGAVAVLEGAVVIPTAQGPRRRDVKLPKASWNTGLLKLENQYVWLRQDEHLAVKEQTDPEVESPPENDDDGKIIPFQAEGVADLETTDDWETIKNRLCKLLQNLRDAEVIAS